MSTTFDLNLSDSQEAALARGLQALLLGLAGFGLVVGSPDVIVNATGALLVALLPTVARRWTDVEVDFGIELWLTAATLVHAIGILGPYRTVWWWDYVTHALSATVVTGVGFAALRAAELDSRLTLPDPARSVVLFCFVVAVAVSWEVMEFAVGKGSQALGYQSPLVVFGPGDITGDILATTLGGVLIVLWGRGPFRSLARKLSVNWLAN